MNEQPKEQMKDQTNKQTNERMNEWLNDFRDLTTSDNFGGPSTSSINHL